MMNNHLVFAAAPMDALDKCLELGLKFEETTWVMNYQLLGGKDYSDYSVHYTDLFRNTPAYAEAHQHFGDEAPMTRRP